MKLFFKSVIVACKSAALKELISSSVVGDAKGEGVGVSVGAAEYLFGAGAPLGKGTGEVEGAGDSAKPCALIEMEKTIPHRRISRNITRLLSANRAKSNIAPIMAAFEMNDRDCFIGARAS